MQALVLGDNTVREIRLTKQDEAFLRGQLGENFTQVMIAKARLPVFTDKVSRVSDSFRVQQMKGHIKQIQKRKENASQGR